MRLRLTCRASIDDAHAAAGDLLQQFVIAEVGDVGQAAGLPQHLHGWRQRGRFGVGHALRQLDHLILVDEKGGQLGAQSGCCRSKTSRLGAWPASTACR